MSNVEYAIMRYSHITQVVSLYYDNETFWVFTDNRQYDSALMDRLLNIELELDQWRLDQFIEYMPIVLADPAMVVSTQAICAYRRETIA